MCILTLLTRSRVWLLMLFWTASAIFAIAVTDCYTRDNVLSLAIAATTITRTAMMIVMVVMVVLLGR